MKTSITITNMHPRGFAFGVTDDGGQIFIPPHIATEHTIQGGDKIEALLTINPNGIERERTPWLAVRLYTDAAGAPDPIEVSAPEPAASVEQRDAAVYRAICGSQYMTSAEIAAQTGTDTSTAINSATRLFAKGMVAKADVYSRAGQTRASFSLWAQSANNFTE